MASKLTIVVLLLSLVALSQAKPRGRRLLQQRARNDDKNKGSVKGDPVLTAFDGQEFEFHGKPNHFYNLASQPGVFQVTTWSMCNPPIRD